MRQVSLRDDSVFSRRVNRTLYLLFKNRKDDFLEMIKDQTPAYWIGFVITFYDLYSRHRGTEFVLGTSDTADFAQVFFINFHDMFVRDRPEHIVTFVSDVVAMARYGKFMACMEATQTELHNNVIKIDGMVSFERLFGDRRDVDSVYKVSQTHHLHLVAVGALLTVFDRWLVAEPCRKVDWKAPDSWSLRLNPNHLFLHLKRRWGQQLLKMLPVQGTVLWWDSDHVEEYESKVFLHSSSTLRHDGSSSVLRLLELNDTKDKVVMWSAVGRGFPTVLMRLVFVRQLSFIDCGTIFHPYAQLPTCLHSEVIGPRIWSSELGVKGLLVDAMWRKGRNFIQLNVRVADNLLCDILDIHLEVKKAIQLDASFHDSVAMQTGWTSPDIVARLLWNMPLCIKWLEWALIKTNKFEAVFLPFCHFPVRKKVAGVLEGMLAVLSHEPRLLAKAAIIVAEKIWLHEEGRSRLGRCRYSRSLLKFCLERLLPKMEFFNEGRCYTMLKFVLEEAWTTEELATGLISSSASKNDFRYVCDGRAADINIDLCFSQNYRNMSYWFNVKEPSELEFSKQQYMEAMAKIEAFKNQIENPQVLPESKERVSLKYDLEYYRKYGLEVQRDLWNQPLSVVHVVNTCAYLQAVEFLVMHPQKKLDVDLCKQIIPDVAAKIPDVEWLTVFSPFNYLPNYEYVPEKQLVQQQDMLAWLLMADHLRVMADLNARLCMMVSPFLRVIPCPGRMFFFVAYEEMSLVRSGASVTSVDEATALLRRLGSAEIVDDATVAEPEVSNSALLRDDPVKELELKRVCLLRAVSRAQYQKEMDKQGRYCKYPLLFHLEYRFVEELAALRKCRDMGHLQAEQRLVRLLSWRLDQMTGEYQRWRAAGGVPRGEEPPEGKLRQDDVVSSACILEVRMLAILLQLKSVFSAYLAPFRTTHPFSETSEALVLRLSEILVLNSKRTYTVLPWAQLCAALESSGLDYLQQLLDDCLTVWGVPQFWSDPCSVPEDGLQHAQLVHVGMTHLLLVLTHRKASLGDQVPHKVLLAVFGTLVEAGTLIHLEGLGSRSDVLKEVKSRLLEVYGAVVPFAHALQQVNWSTFADTGVWRGFSQQWLDCLRSARTGDLALFFKRIKFDEFMARTSEKPMKCVGSESEVGSSDVAPAGQVGTGAAAAVVGSPVGESQDKPGSGSQHGGDAKEGGVPVATDACSPSSLPLNCCFGCQKKEAAPRTFKECDKCLSERWCVVRVYCSPECRASDWGRRHGREHSVGEQESDYGPDDSLGID